MPLEIEHFRRRFDEILQRVSDVPESRTPAISAGLDELRGLLSEIAVSAEELYYKIGELLAGREALENERNHYRELFDGAPDAHIVTDFGGQIQLANRAAGTLLQVRPDTLVSQSLLRFVAESDRSLIHEHIARLRRSATFVHHWSLWLRPRQEESFAAFVTVAGGQIPPDYLHWVVREASVPRPPA